MPGGLVKDEQGNCVTPPPPVDVCPNIGGRFETANRLPGGTYTFPRFRTRASWWYGQSVWVIRCVKEHNPPPQPPPTVTSDEFIDVQVIKDATAQVQLVNGQADLAYTVRIRNNGPNQAHNIQLVDAAPAGVLFLAITQQPVAGTCTITSALLSCSLGTLGPGVERTIAVSARVTQTGTYVNSATGNWRWQGHERRQQHGRRLDPRHGSRDAARTTRRRATLKPKPKPTSKPTPEVCRILKVTPGMVKVNGKQQLVLAKVTQSKNPVAGVAVRFAGKGFAKVVKTNAQGVARFSVKPSKAGIMLVRITSAKACNSARIGVLGAFEPPVTG